jgi:hypothetical protein
MKRRKLEAQDTQSQSIQNQTAQAKAKQNALQSIKHIQLQPFKNYS